MLLRGYKDAVTHHKKSDNGTPGSQFYNFLQKQLKFLSCEAKYLLFFLWGGFASHPNLGWKTA